MPLLILIVLAVLLVVLVESGVIPSPFSRVHLVVDNGKTVIAKGALGPRAKELVADIIREKSVGNGFITISRSGKVRFSSSIPSNIRQQLRNVVNI
jgi:hypothetical protein